MSVEKRGDGYTVRWRDSSGRQRSQQIRLWRDAVALDGEMKRKRAMGELIAHEKGTITCDEFWRIWLERYGGAYLTPRSVDTYRRLYSKHIAVSIGSSRLKDLDRETISKLILKLTGTLSPGSVRKVLVVLQGMLERGVEWGYIPANPAKGIRKPRLVQRRGRAIDENELSALVLELPSLRDQVIVRVLAGTGMRPGELRALRWNIRRSETIPIETAVSSNEIGPTKTNSIRSVRPTHDAALALREWWIASTAKQGNYSLVFPAVRGEGVWTDNGWRLWHRRVFAPAAARAGLGGLRPYDLRHSYASHRIADGTDILTLASQLGHSPTMTLTVYGHLLTQGRTDGTGK